MKSLGLLIAVLVRRTADYSSLRRQRTPCTGDLCVPVSGERVIHIRVRARLAALTTLQFHCARLSLRIRISSKYGDMLDNIWTHLCAAYTLVTGA